MSGYWDSVDYVNLPVKLVNGRWELLYGGGIGARDGAYGELRLAVSGIEDATLRKRLTQSVTVKVLDEGTELIVALRDRERQLRSVDQPAVNLADLPAGCTRFERIRIGQKTRSTQRIDSERGGLWLRQRGVDRTELVCSTVEMPEGVDTKVASSLNHACTLLSEVYEKHRISHTLNVYQHVFYPEIGDSGSFWHPLEALRNGVISGMERSILADAWSQLEEQLGFRPVPRPNANARRQGRGQS